MSTIVTELGTCRLCGSRRLQLALALEPTPLGDDFVPAERCGQTQPSYPLNLLLCGECANVQLQHVVNPDAIYREYTYTSSVSLELKEHFQRYAAAVLDRFNPRPDALVVEIGSNEGALLRAFRDQGLRVLGVDPAREIARGATAAGIETLPMYFSEELARGICRDRGHASIMIANNVMANINDLSDVFAGVRALLAPDGVFILETSYCLDVVQKALIDTVFHEHLNYFSVAPLARCLARHGLELIDAERVLTKGGSLRVSVQLAGGPRGVSAGAAALIAEESHAGLDSLAPYQALAANLDLHRKGLVDRLRQWRAEGRTMAGYGAAVGLTTMIYHFGLGEYLSYIADDNPTKQHTFSPGLHLPVLPSESLYQRKPDYVVVLAWRYIEPIAKRHKAFLEQGGRFVVPLPEVRVIDAG